MSIWPFLLAENIDILLLKFCTHEKHGMFLGIYFIRENSLEDCI